MAPIVVKDGLLQAAFHPSPGEVKSGRGKSDQKKAARWTAFCKSRRGKSALLRRPARILGLRTVAALGHELIELGLVLRRTKALEEIAEFALFFL